MSLGELDLKLAEHFLPQLLRPVEFGENAVFFWFPGTGMTTITQDIWENFEIWPKELRLLRTRNKIIQLWGHLSEARTLGGLLSTANFYDQKEMRVWCQKALDSGKDPFVVIGRVDNFPEKEKLALLKFLVNLNAINRRRIHIVLNLVDKPWFEAMLVTYPEFVVLANQMGIVPLLSGELLVDYIKTRAKEYKFAITSSMLADIVNTYGGVLQLTREYFRSGGKADNLELKLRNIITFLPSSYKRAIEDKIVLGKARSSQTVLDLEEFGVWDLILFKKHWNCFGEDPSRFLTSLLTSEEKELWKLFQINPGKTLSKEQIINVLRPDNSQDVSFWAIDKAVSRFRKKLVRSGIDPQLLRTLKGRGYVWEG